MSELSQKIRSLWFEADQLAKESKAIALDGDDLDWVTETITLLAELRERVRITLVRNAT